MVLGPPRAAGPHRLSRPCGERPGGPWQSKPDIQSWQHLKPAAWSVPIMGLILAMIEILYDPMYENPRTSGSMVVTGSCRIFKGDPSNPKDPNRPQ